MRKPVRMRGLPGKKPRAMRGAFKKKERQRYRSAKGAIFPKSKKSEWGAALCKTVSRISRSIDDRGARALALNEYFFSLIPKPAKERLAFLGFKEGRRVPDLDDFKRRVRDCPPDELARIEEAIAVANSGLKKLANRINSATMSIDRKVAAEEAEKTMHPFLKFCAWLRVRRMDDMEFCVRARKGEVKVPADYWETHK